MPVLGRNEFHASWRTILLLVAGRIEKFTGVTGFDGVVIAWQMIISTTTKESTASDINPYMLRRDNRTTHHKPTVLIELEFAICSFAVMPLNNVPTCGEKGRRML